MSEPPHRPGGPHGASAERPSAAGPGTGEAGTLDGHSPTAPGDAGDGQPPTPPDAGIHGPSGDAAVDGHSPTPHDAARALHGRLHPSVIALWTLQSFAPLAALWIASSAERAIGLVGIAIALVSAWVRWTRFRWRIEADQLIIAHGLIQRTRRVIPVERIQAVQAVRKVRHRIFGVVGLRIETVGGKESEGQLDALRPQTAVAVQQALLRSPTAAQAPSAAPQGSVLVHCAPRDLLIAGLTGGRVGVAAAGLAFLQEFAGQRVADAVLSAPQRFGVTVVVMIVLAGAVAAFVLSVLTTAVTYWDFTVTRDDGLLRLHRGLLAERRDTVPLARLQSLTVEENLVRRAFGLAAVKMVVAGRAGEDESLTSTLLPIASRAQAFALVGRVLGIDGLDSVQMRPMPRAARARRLVRAAVVVLVLSVPAWVLLDGPLRLVGLATVVVAVPAALAAYRALGWHVDGRVVVGRRGWLVRRTSVTPLHAPQSVRVTLSPFQRRRHLATLRLEIARSRGAADPRLIDLGRVDAERLQLSLAGSAPTGLQMSPGAT